MFARTTDNPLLIDGAEVCARLSIGKSKLHQMIRAGRFPVSPIRLGRAVRYSAADLSAWVAAGCPASDRWRAMLAVNGRRIGGAA
jgi:excisionase family DNA binding protein